MTGVVRGFDYPAREEPKGIRAGSIVGGGTRRREIGRQEEADLRKYPYGWMQRGQGGRQGRIWKKEASKGCRRKGRE